MVKVKNMQGGSYTRVAKTKGLIMENGERTCVLIDEGGMPLFYPNLFLTTQVRNRSLSSSTVTNHAGHLCAFLQAMAEARIDLIERMSTGSLMEPHEVEGLRSHLQQRIVMQPIGPLGSYFSTGEYVSKAVLHARVGIAMRYVEWMGSRYLRSPRDSEELTRIVAAFKELRPLDKRRNIAKRTRGLDKITSAAVLEVLTPGSTYNIWEGPDIQSRNRLMLSLLYELGLRRGELLNLKVEDIDFKKSRLFVMRRADEKGDPRVDQPLVKTKDRELVMKASLLRETLEYITNHRRLIPSARKHGFLFVTHKAGPTIGQPLSISGYKDVINSLRSAVPPLRAFSGHDLRHYWNERFSELSEKLGFSPAEEEQVRSQLMGWSFGSGTAATYNKRHIERKAAEHSLQMQEASLRPVKGVAK